MVKIVFLRYKDDLSSVKHIQAEYAKDVLSPLNLCLPSYFST